MPKCFESDSHTTSHLDVKPKALGPIMIVKPKTLDPDILSDLNSVDLMWLSDSRRLDMIKILDASYFFIFSKPKSIIVLYIEIKKNLKYSFPTAYPFFFFFYLGGKTAFLLL